MAKTKTADRVYTQAEVAAMLAAARAEGAEDARKAKSAARAERSAALEKPGLTMFTTTADRLANNILAEGLYVVPGVCRIEATAMMVKHDGGFRCRFRLAANPIFGVNGDTDTDPERLVKTLTAKAKAAPEIVASLAAEYAKHSASHVWRDKAAERKAKAAG